MSCLPVFSSCINHISYMWFYMSHQNWQLCLCEMRLNLMANISMVNPEFDAFIHLQPWKSHLKLSSFKSKRENVLRMRNWVRNRNIMMLFIAGNSWVPISSIGATAGQRKPQLSSGNYDLVFQRVTKDDSYHRSSIVSSITQICFFFILEKILPYVTSTTTINTKQ